MTKEKELLQTIDGAFQSYKEAEQKEIEKQQGYKILQKPKLDRSELITPKELSETSVFSYHTIKKFCDEPDFPCIHIGCRTYIFKSKVWDWLAAHIGARF